MEDNKKVAFLEMPVKDVLKFLKNWLRKNLLNVLKRNSWNIVGFLLIFSIFMLGTFSQQFRNTFLFDKNGSFEWIGVSAIIGVIGLFINSKNKRREIYANLLSKNKLETLSNFKKDLSRFSALIWKYNNILRPLVDAVGLDNFLKNHMGAVDDDEDREQLLDMVRKDTDKLNEIYFELKQTSIEMELDISEKNDEQAHNVIEQITSLLHEIDIFLGMLQNPSNSSNTILKQYYKIVEANKALVVFSVEYSRSISEKEIKRYQINDK